MKKKNKTNYHVIDTVGFISIIYFHIYICNWEKQGIQGMILCIADLFAKRFGFSIKPSLGNLNMWCIFWMIF